MSVETSVNLRIEKGLVRRRSGLVAGMDEVGRGSVFGPVAVGVTITDTKGPWPRGVRDSKLLSEAARNGLVAAIKKWALASAVGYASASEIDEYGILSALCLAGRRALGALDVVPTWVLLDGSYDWLSRSVIDSSSWPSIQVGEVVTKVKADRACVSVAAASVLAKVERDQKIIDMAGAFPGYGLERHKGYLTKAHSQAILELGASSEHRRSWNLPRQA